MRRTSSAYGSIALAAVVLGTLFGASAADAGKKPPPPPDVNPIIFVHGAFGSGAQFESQALRFASNGYPQSFLTVVEYDSGGLSFPEDLPVVHAQIDARIAELKRATGRAQVDVLGHSRGTTVMHDYLSLPERAANIAHYVNIDGRSAAAPPGGVPTLALWAGAVDRPVQGEIGGAINVTIPNQEHVEVATSAESFVEMFRFLTGEEPARSRIARGRGPFAISGRAVLFPDNVGVEGATLEIWAVHRRSGERLGRKPRARLVLGEDGAFRFDKVRRKRHYELVLRRGADAPVLHYFFEPFLRSDHLVRLFVAPLLEALLEPGASAAHSSVTVLRNKEFWGDRGPENDVLAIDGTDVINATTAPSGEVGTASVALFAFDADSDGVSHLESVAFPFPLVPFITGTDLFIPADPPRTVSIETVPRGDFGAARTLKVRNIPSTEGAIVVQLHDFEP